MSHTRVTPHVARAVLAMRAHLRTTEAGRTLGLKREAVVVYVRTVEQIVEARLFVRSKGNRHRWELVPGNDDTWAMLEKRGRRAPTR